MNVVVSRCVAAPLSVAVGSSGSGSGGAGVGPLLGLLA